MTESRCLVCSCPQTKDLNMHGYPYLKCGNCDHIFSLFSEKGIRKNIRKFESRKRANLGYMLQNTFTDSYFKERNKKDDAKIENTKSFLTKGNILDINANVGNFVRTMMINGYEISGIDTEQEYETYWDEDTVFERKPLRQLSLHKKYDNIIMFDTLEYCYCPYSFIVEAFLRLSPGGRVIAKVPIDNNPKENYLARSQEFSKKSVQIFAKNCSTKVEFESLWESEIFVLKI